jgi:GNAT superfamily N-acetyltransferase
MESKLILRAAGPDDRPAMERITAHTFEWGDYVSGAWDDWLADEEGLALVGQQGDVVVALGKITFQTADQVWLEGMRVDPDYRQRGIAGRFLDYSIDYARRRGARVVRLGTGWHNTAIHRLMTREGMERVGSYVLWIADPLQGDDSPSFLTPEFGPSARTFLDSSPVLAHTQGLCSFDWEWREFSADLLADLLKARQVAARFAADGSLAALAPIHFDPDDRRLWIGFADGQPTSVTALARETRMHAAKLGAEKVQVMLPDLNWLRDAFRSAGYGFGEWEGQLWIFESRLVQSGRLDQSQAGDDYDC